MSLTQTSRIYRVLREVAVLGTPSYYPSVIVVAERTGLNDGAVRSIARRVSSYMWDCWAPTDESEQRSHPWLIYYRHQDSMSITDDGRTALHNARSSPVLPVDVSEWQTEVLTGMDEHGEQTGIDNAVLSSKGLARPGRRDPELATMRRQNIAAYGVPLETMTRLARSGHCWCECCHRRGLPPFHPQHAFRMMSRNGTRIRRHECKDCEKHARQERRMKVVL